MKRCLQEKKGLELLNIPISVSLLYEKEYENMMSKKRRSVSEKRTATYEKNKSTPMDTVSVAKFL